MEIKNENIVKFLDKVGKDQELQAKISQLREPEEAYKLAASVQEGFTQEEFITEMKRLYKETTKDLSEDDLLKVAGGLDVTEAVSAATSAIGSSAAGVSIGIAAGMAAT